MELNYEKNFQIEIINETAAIVHGRVLNHVLKNGIDKDDLSNPATDLLDKLQEAMQVNLYDLEQQQLLEMKIYWTEMDSCSEHIIAQYTPQESPKIFSDENTERINKIAVLRNISNSIWSDFSKFIRKKGVDPDDEKNYWARLLKQMNSMLALNLFDKTVEDISALMIYWKKMNEFLQEVKKG